MITLTIPWPPSANRYWRVYRGKPRRSPAARAFRKNVIATVMADLGQIKPLEGELGVSLRLIPPDNRRRDADNVQKPILDALEHAGVYRNDNQVSELHTFRGIPEPPGAVLVEVWQLWADVPTDQADRHPLAELLRFSEMLTDADAVLGSRAHLDYIKPAMASMRPLARSAAEAAGRIEADLIAGRYSPLADPP